MPNIAIQHSGKAARIIRDAGGKVVGRTRLQKIAYLLEMTRLGEGFQFEYRHYGPYSEQLASDILMAAFMGLIHEEEHSTDWGGSYSVYTAAIPADLEVQDVRKAFIDVAASADPVSLELAATAAFLAFAGSSDPWTETARRKPEKAVRLESAKTLYGRLRRIPTPGQLPAI